jgi:Phosphotransferase enzyme family
MRKGLRTNAAWFGLTHREDLAFVSAGILKLVEQGGYPAKLMDITDASGKHDIGAVARRFQIHGGFVGAVPYGSGHINDSYCATFDHGGARVRYIFQRINRGIFKDTEALMENIQRVTTHLAGKRAGEADQTRRVLTLIPALDGKPYACDEHGDAWRVYIFIEGARTFDAVEFPQQAFQAAKAFGEFQRLLTELPPPRLHDTIPDFHHTPKRYAALERAIEADAANRAKLALGEIEFARRHMDICSVLLDAELPERVTHNDTKFNNVMLDDATGEGICVIDLDTVMPGLAPYDFGDMVRTTTSASQEDERDLSKVTMQFEMFEALARGYLSSAGEFLTPAEKELLPFSGKLITFEIGIRFLTDFLAGDTYFKVHREGHNLDRCRTQFKLVESMEEQDEQMNQLIARI